MTEETWKQCGEVRNWGEKHNGDIREFAKAHRGYMDESFKVLFAQ